MNDNLENEMTAEDVLLKNLNGLNPEFYDPTQRAWNFLAGKDKAAAVLSAMEQYLTLKTSPLVQQLEEAKKEIEKLKLPQESDYVANELIGQLKEENEQLIERLEAADSVIDSHWKKILELEALAEEKTAVNVPRYDNDYGDMCENPTGDWMLYDDLVKHRDAENTLLKSQLEEAKNAFHNLHQNMNKASEEADLTWHKRLEEKDREIERMKGRENQYVEALILAGTELNANYKRLGYTSSNVVKAVEDALFMFNSLPSPDRLQERPSFREKPQP